ncbi:unnamed protein product [Ectocarpus sp. 8 AP-2014]
MFLNNQAPPPPPSGLLSPQQGFVVHAVLVNSRMVSGVRRQVYRMASRHCGRYTNTENPSESIGYVEEDLVINIAFPSEDQVTAFGDFLQELGGEDSPICGKFELLEDNRQYHISDKIWFKDYKQGDSDSPPRTFSSASDSSVLNPGDPTALYQSVENPGVVKQSCHMYGKKKPKRDDLPNHVSNLNNRVCLSPTLHVLYDGYERGMSPVVRVKPVTIHAEPVHACSGGVSETRYKVDVLIEFLDLPSREMYNGGFKSGYVQRTPTQFLTSMLVLNPEEFSKFMMWKYNDTTDKWP